MNTEKSELKLEDTTPLLLEVAAWENAELREESRNNIIVGVPALQRGLVWKPQQVELLWDSILRGFPIGSLVICKIIEVQNRKQSKDITHHLLDGQQRCNAITLGFSNPFADPTKSHEAKAILWLDLAPDGTKFPGREHSRIPSNSTRQFLVRVTTSAHPWGFNATDEAGRLSVSEMRRAIEQARGETIKKPLPSELFPSASNVPVPFGLLLEAHRKAGDKEERDFWNFVINKLETYNYRWARLAIDYIKQDDNSRQKSKIFNSIKRAGNTRLVLLKVPDDLLGVSEIANMEQLFFRLNRQGTRLEGEELAYSMIKAYWPEVVAAIDEIDAKKMRRFPASRLVTLGFRAALSDRTKIAAPLGIPQLRSIAAATQHGARDENIDRRKTIQRYFGINEQGEFQGNSRLLEVCEIIQKWLMFDKVGNPKGVPPEVLSAFAKDSPDIYLTLMLLCDHISDPMDERWNPLIIGVATLIHWFACGDKSRIANMLRTKIDGKKTFFEIREATREAINEAMRDGLIIEPQDPSAIGGVINFKEMDESSIANWKRYLLFEKIPTDSNKWMQFFNQTKGNRGLLLYAQREFLANRFQEYDPARIDLWEDTNRPWDYDHLHPNKFVANQQGKYISICREWQNCIGNLRAWPFEDNRADGADRANVKIQSDEDKTNSLITETDLSAFSKSGARKNFEDAQELCEAIKERYIRIYRVWHDAVCISDLIQKNDFTDSSDGIS